jgi:membrane-bound acyltransferase YfiQ involved in biofilm formation
MSEDTKFSVKAFIVFASALIATWWMVSMDSIRVFADSTLQFKPLAQDVLAGVILGAVVGYVIILVINMFIDFE